MDIDTAAGEKVVFIGRNGYDMELKKAMTHLEVGEELTVQRIEVSQSSSAVVFNEAPGLRFNTCMFKNNTPTWERFHWFAHCYTGIAELTQEDYAEMPFNREDMSDAVLMQLALADQDEEMVADESHTIRVRTLDEIEAIMADEEPKVRNKIVTACRYTHECVSVLNPKNEQEVIDAFMEQYGEEPRSFYTVHFEKTFNPKDIMPSSSSDC